MEYSSFTLLGVVLIVVLGVAFSIYSICKGCSGLHERGMTARSFLSPTTILVQRFRAHQASTGEPYTISGQTVQDKSPPPYEELFAPPPSYEESMELNKLARQKRNTSAAPESVTLTLHSPPAVIKGDEQGPDKDAATVDVAEKALVAHDRETGSDASFDGRTCSSVIVTVPHVVEEA